MIYIKFSQSNILLKVQIKDGMNKIYTPLNSFDIPFLYLLDESIKTPGYVSYQVSCFRKYIVTDWLSNECG
ncbi:hypothetical protein SAMN05421636_107319 [Pricia antarctica]|uniref:Uncharacterized protein n=1 Tax=Pricia antarctica TaxID=641691 RepID=A0A1G7FX46_9FLAO|nr:hypothetical protein SAMN05421636_107319 [Pricia antarctica]